MKTDQKIKGEVTEALRNAQFRVKLDDTENPILCYLAGKMRINNINVYLGDKVEVVLSPDGHLLPRFWRGEVINHLYTLPIFLKGV